MESEKLKQITQIMELWENILKETEKLSNNAKEEAYKLEAKGRGLYIVSDEAIKLVRGMKEETIKLNLFLTHEKELESQNKREILDTLMQRIDQIDLLVLNGNIEAARAKECEEEFKVIFEELKKLGSHMLNIISNLKITIFGKEETNLQVELLNLLSKATGRNNLLALNSSIEAVRSGENGRSFMIIAEEIKNVSEYMHELLKQLEIVIAKEAK